MFESLSARLQDVFKSLRGEARLTESSVDAALRDGIGRAEVEAADGYKYTVVVAGASDMDAIPLGYTAAEHADARAFPAWLGDDAG